MEGGAGSGTQLNPRAQAAQQAAIEAKKVQLRDQIAAIEAAVVGEKKVADSQRESNEQLKKRAEFDAEGVQYLTSREQLERAVVRVRNEGLAAGKSEAEIQERIGQIRRQFDPGAAESVQIARIDNTKRNLTSLIAAYQDAEQVLETNRQAGLVGERDYYEAKVGFIKLNAEAQRRIIEEDTKAQRVLLSNPNLNTAETTAIQTRIKDNIAEIEKLQKRAAASGVNAATQQTAAQRALAAAYQQSRDAAEDYLRTLVRSQQRDLSGFGLGNEERARQSGRNQIADKYDDDLLRAEAQVRALRVKQGGDLTDEQQKDFDDQLALIREFRERALGEYDLYYEARRKQEGDAQSGAQEALTNYVDSQRNAARTTQEAYEHAFSSLEDTLTDFFTTGKLNVKSLVNTILAELARIEAKKLIANNIGSVGSFLGAIFGGATGGGLSIDTSGAGSAGGSYLPDSIRGGRAIGGPVSAGQTYEVNERDIPEIARVGGRDYLTMGNQGGKVMPLDGAVSGPTFHISIAAGVTRTELASYIPEMTRQIKASVQGDMNRPGGRA
ncbi:MAG: phage tail tape measure protein [Rubrivivax sp.]|nr:MAG: phage tail tape measure protein [Rubrivivax sp.]